MGRTALPDELKKLRGTAKKCRQKNTSSAVGVCKPLTSSTAPKWLSKEARKIYNETAKMLISWKVLTRLDVNMLAAYSAAYANLMLADHDMAEAQTYFYEKQTANGVTIEMHPAAKMFKDSLDLVNKIGGQFGLSPIARRGMTVFAAAAEKKEVDPFDEFVR